jgi:hypothetical protein
MKRAYLREHGKSSLELIEEALYLVRRASPVTLAMYYLGAAPFVLGLLIFWADMSRSPFAARHVAGASLGVALLFLWMKIWQTVYMGRLSAQVAGAAVPVWTIRRCARALVQQAVFQSTALFIVPVALLMVLPFVWVISFYQCATLHGDGGRQDLREVVLKACRQSSIWPVQNHLLLLFLMGFGIILLLNWVTVFVSLPQLGSTLLGMETVFSRSPYSLLNTTFLATMLGLTYLCLDPLVRACFVLRGFYADSLTSGDDLTSELKHHVGPRSARLTVAGLVLILGISDAQGAEAWEPLAPSDSTADEVVSSIPLTEFNQVIDDVLEQAKYRWRLPRETVVEDVQKGVVRRFFDRATELVRGWFRSMMEWIEALLDRLFRREPGADGVASGGSMTMTQGLLILVIILSAGALGIFLYRLIRDRRRSPVPLTAVAVQPVPNLADEMIGADQLPEDEWSRLGHELLERGELRLALRAFHLASLSHLAGRGLVTIARFKSNRDYERELERRGHALPDVAPVFRETVWLFERSWYGLHEVNTDLVQQFVGDVERLKAAG